MTTLACESLTQEDRAIIEALHQRAPIVGISTLMSQILEGSRGCDAHMQRHLVALKQLVDSDLVWSVAVGGTLRMTLTARGRQVARAIRSAAPQRRQAGDVRRPAPWALCASVVAIAAGGCMTAPPPQQARAMLMPYPTAVGMQQLRSGDGTYFVPCNPCAPPSPKTPVLPGEDVAIATVPSSSAETPRPRLALVQALPVSAPAPLPALPATSINATPATPEVTRLSIQFAFGEVLISHSDRGALERLAPVAKRSAMVSLKGGADSFGNATANEAVAKARTAAVQSELRRLGVPAARIRATHCATCYVAPNDSADGRKRNRRVDIEIASVDAKAKL